MCDLCINCERRSPRWKPHFGGPRDLVGAVDPKMSNSCFTDEQTLEPTTDRTRAMWRFVAAICVWISCASTSRAQAHVPEPAVNLGDTSFLDARGGPGLLVEEIGEATHIGRIAGPSGLTM